MLESVTVLELAKILHDSYRAAFKALHGHLHYYPGERFATRHGHDHSFLRCTKRGRKYFVRRAKLVIKEREQTGVPF